MEKDYSSDRGGRELYRIICLPALIWQKRKNILSSSKLLGRDNLQTHYWENYVIQRNFFTRILCSRNKAKAQRRVFKTFNVAPCLLLQVTDCTGSLEHVASWEHRLRKIIFFKSYVFEFF